MADPTFSDCGIPAQWRIRARWRALGLVVILLAVIGCGGSVSHSSAAEQEPGKGPGNRLSKETSPYLLLHAHNPVDWYPWGPEAFEKARKENKLIFLSIGYSSCYWCHVMERLVFSQPEIARQMNQQFVNIKVDREERPDIDEIYMTAMQVYFQAIGSSQGGGWPLSIFLTPNLKPLGGGTYFPPEDKEGRDGFPTIMARISKAWVDKPEEMQRSADALGRAVQNVLRVRPSLQPIKLEQGLIDTAVKELAATGDKQYGGIDFNPQQPDRPKFPVPVKLSLLQSSLEGKPNDAISELLYLTLDKLAAGGIHDQLGGGFHRYSTDRMWRVPHFEKMLYDNAQLADVFVTAYVATSNPVYRAVAEDTFMFVLKELTDPLGGFHSALDAETDGIEGQYYVWSREEIRSLLDPDDVRLIARHWGLDREPFFEHGYVLEVVVPVAQLADDFKIPAKEAAERIETIKSKLLAIRDKRRALLKDDKILTSWNGLMIRALAHGAKALNRPEYLAAAEKAAEFILTNMRENGRLLRTYRSRVAKVPAYLDDYAYLIEGLIALHEATNDEKWLNAAARLMEQQKKLFWDDRLHGFYFMATDHEELLARTKTVHDSVLPSGNSVSVRNLVRMANLMKKPEFRETAEQTLLVCAPALRDTPRSATNLALALSEFLALDPKSRKPGLNQSQEPDTPDDKTDDSKRDGIGSIEPRVPNRDEDVALIQDLEQFPNPVIPKGLSRGGRTSPTPGKSAMAGNRTLPGKSKSAEVVSGRAFVSTQKLPPGKTCEFLVLLNIEEGWHINPNPAADEYAIETELSIGSNLKLDASDISYPRGDEHTVKGKKKTILCYSDQVEIRGLLEIPDAAAGKQEVLEFRVRYQACNDVTCLSPKTLKIKIPVSVARKGERVKPANTRLFHESP